MSVKSALKKIKKKLDDLEQLRLLHLLAKDAAGSLLPSFYDDGKKNKIEKLFIKIDTEIYAEEKDELIEKLSKRMVKRFTKLKNKRRKK